MINSGLDEMQKRAAIVEKVEENVFVEAGAGAGKTTLIVQRILNQLKSGKVNAEQIVVITFTNKAAEELYSRIEGALRRQAKDDGNSDEERQHLQVALRDIANMNISTIHSFCHRLLLEHSFEAKLPLDVQLLEEEEAKPWKKELFDQWFATLSDEAMKELKQFIGYSYKGYLLDAFLQISDMAEEIAITYQKDALKKKYQEFETDFIALKDKIEQSILAKVNDVLEAQYADIQDVFSSEKTKKEVKEFLEEEAGISWFCKLENTLEKGLFQLSVKKDKKERIEELNEQCVAVVRGIDLETIQEEYYATCFALLMDYAVQAREFYKTNRGSQYITNDLLLQKARDLVCKNELVHADVVKRYKCLYVDEFQDVDPVQAELVMCIAQKKLDRMELREGSLFLVGDPKQSIYRFRGAEPAIYYDIKQSMIASQDGQVYELDNNYRSDEKVIDWVNAYFKKDKFRPMVYPHPNYTESDDTVLSGVYRYNDNKCMVEGKNLKEKAGKDAQQLAEMIRFLVDNQKKIVYLDENGEFHKKTISYGDFLILCFKMEHMGEYTKCLSEQGIPVQISGKVNVNENMVLQHFLLLYQYLICPQNRLYKEGALQVILKEEITDNNEKTGQKRLKQLRDATKGMSGSGIAGYLLSHMELLLPVDINLSGEKILSAQTKLEQMVETVLSKTEGNPLEMAAAFSKYLGKKVERELFLEESVDAVRFMNVHKSKGLEGNIVIVADRSENVGSVKEEKVRCRKKNGDEVEYFYFGCIENADNSYGKKYSDFQHGDIVRQYAAEERRKEQTRLEYVTVTRAKHALIFMSPLREDCAFQGMDLSQQRSITEMMEEVSKETQKPEQSKAGTEEVRKYESVSVEIDASMSGRQYVGISPSDLEKGVHAEKRKEDTEQEDVESESVKQEIATHEVMEQVTVELAEESECETDADGEGAVEKKDERPKGNIFGTVMHRCFELLMEKWQREQTIEGVRERFDAVMGELDDIITLAIMENQKDMKKRYGTAYSENVQKYREYLRKVLTDFMEDGEVKKLLADTKTIYTEYPFSFYTSKKKDPTLMDAIAKWLPEIAPEQEIWVNGTADLVLCMKDGRIVIVDYKSDIKKADWTEEDFEKHLSKYDGQLMLYKYAMAKIFSIPVEQVETRLYPIARKE